MDLRLHTEDELKQLRCEAIELRDMKTYKEVLEEMNRRQKYDL